MTEFDPTQSAEWLFQQHRAGARFAPLAPLSELDALTHAYDIQDRFVALLRGNDAALIAGYKIGLTTPRMQQMCGIDQPIAGMILAKNVRHSPATVREGDFVRLGIESELAVQLARPLVGDRELSIDEIAGSIGRFAAAFELIEDRNADYRSLDAMSLIADNSWNAGIVLGHPVEAAEIDEIDGVLQIDGKFADKGNSRDVLGHPFAAVAWLAKHLARRSKHLEAGQWVMTGSVVPTRFAQAGERYEFALGALPPVTLTVT